MFTMLDMALWGNGFELKINKHNSLLAVWNSFSADFGETGRCYTLFDLLILMSPSFVAGLL